MDTSKGYKNRILSAFAKKVRLRRRELGLTQEQLAENADLHVNYIGGIERVVKNPSLISIIVLAKALKVSPKELLPEESDPDISMFNS